MTKTVLLVDDNETMVSGMETMIEMRFDELSILTAHTGAEAISHLKKQRPDLIFLDINLPDMKGTKILQAVQQKWPGLPVFILSGESDVNNVAGAAGVLLKPVKPKSLNNLISRTLGLD